MAITMHKFQIPSRAGEFSLLMPEDCTILHLEMQQGDPCVWALVDTEHAMVPRHLRIFRTGEFLPDGSLVYIGTFQKGSYVGHLFEVL